MPTATRDQIVDAADQLFYRQGFAHTSFADIADAVEISRGNFYHHFKSKDAILDAVIARRLATNAAVLAAWERDATTPTERIRSFLRILVTNGAHIQRYGCPVGTLCTELAKLRHAALPDASKLFTLFRTWLQQQFAQLGHAARTADELAMQVLAWSQGVATLSATLRDGAFVEREVARMDAWLESIPVKRRRRQESPRR